MKKIRKWLLILWIAGIVVAGIVITRVFSSTKGVSTAADAIVAQFNAGQTEEIYNNSALKSTMSLEDFEAAMGIGSDLDITKAVHLGWNGRGFENGEKYIYGDFLFAGNSKQTLTFWFAEQEEDESLIFLGVTWWAPEGSEDNFDDDFDDW